MGDITDLRSVSIMLSLFHYVEKKKKNFILRDPTQAEATDLFAKEKYTMQVMNAKIVWVLVF